MAWTQQQLIDRLRQELGDRNASASAAYWTDANLQQAINTAIGASWPYFFDPVIDETTYVGTNAQPINTLTYAVPAAFLAAGSGIVSRPYGVIDLIETREWDGSTSTSPIPFPWFKEKRSYSIDPLGQPSPKIRFYAPFSLKTEMRIFGHVPVTPFDTTTLSATLAATDYPGFLTWLFHASEYYARKQVSSSAQLDRTNNNQAMLLSQQAMEKTAAQFRMRPYTGQQR